jgi:hypothetical protein
MLFHQTESTGILASVRISEEERKCRPAVMDDLSISTLIRRSFSMYI